VHAEDKVLADYKHGSERRQDPRLSVNWLQKANNWKKTANGKC